MDAWSNCTCSCSWLACASALLSSSRTEQQDQQQQEGALLRLGQSSWSEHIWNPTPLQCIYLYPYPHHG